MKLFDFFSSQKKEYIGLSGFKTVDVKKQETIKEAKTRIEKTTLTGLLKRV